MNELQKLLLEQLGGQFILALEGMLGERWTASLEEADLPGEGSKYLCWSQKFNVHKEPVVQVVVEESVWRETGKLALTAVGLEDPEESDIRATYLELLTQALSGLARFLTGKAGTEVTLNSGVETQPPGNGAMPCLRLASPSGYVASLYVRVETSVVASLLRENGAPEDSGGAAANAEQPQVQPQRAAAAAGAGGGSGGTSQPAPPSMEMLFDVEMPVSVSFGRTHLALKEVIKLSTGSIIELNRTISEPVEVIVNNCVIARGEVVVVEGNYGVRIQQIVSRSERLKSVD
ncbi:MAG: flagellar motor switch protein FliN [Acidobacteria bacterium]|nr:flagellar motor switch protein FliN [Acidobacteriota bacterium]